MISHRNGIERESTFFIGVALIKINDILKEAAYQSAIEV